MKKFLKFSIEMLTIFLMITVVFPAIINFSTSGLEKFIGIKFIGANILLFLSFFIIFLAFE